MKSTTFVRTILAAALAPCLLAQDTAPAPAAGAAESQPAEFKDIGWPREFKTETHTVIAYQPQVDEWKDFETLKMRMAVGIVESGKEGDETATQYGALFAEVTTSVNKEAGEVLLTDRKATDLVFEGVSDTETERLGGILKAALPEAQDMIISLQRLVAAVDLSEQLTREAEASGEVPPIYFSLEPALLMMFIGEPSFEPVGDTGLLFAVNTNWDVFMTTGEAPAYFLRVDENWFTTKDPKAGVWESVPALPAAFTRLPKDENWEEVNKNIPGKPAAGPMKVIYSDRPAELVVTEGKPAMSPLVGGALLYVTNTESDLFFHPGDSAYYFLSAGRWFTAKTLEDSWRFAEALPAEFASIPEDHAKGHVLACVAGTPAADEAVVLASIPETATVDRAETTITVEYEGDPEFAAVDGAENLDFAVNTNFDVFKTGSKYYCCQQGVWFEAVGPNGPWVVADMIPAAIYSIPSSHPKHNVTYVTVVESTPTTVKTSYTSGYEGSYVVRGIVMFGLGYWIAKERYDYRYPYRYYYRYHCRPPYYGWGCGARPVLYGGGYYRGGGRYYGPYGGAGRGAIYNPRTGGWARGGYAYGPRGSVAVRSAYNPYTNTFGRQVRASTPYGSWSKGVVARDGKWARYESRTNARGRATGVQGSGGGGALRVDKRFGGQGTIARTPGGDIYVGRNGEINKLDPKSGSWKTRTGKSWETAGKSSLKRVPTTGGTKPAIDTSRRPGALPTTGKIPVRPATGKVPTRPSTGNVPTRPSTGNVPTRPSTGKVPTTRPSTGAVPTRPATGNVPSRPPVTKPAPSKIGQLDRQAFDRNRGAQNTQRARSSSSSRGRSSSRGDSGRGRLRGR